MPQPTARLILAATLCLAALTAAIAPARAHARDAQDILDRLDHPEHDTRQAATAELLADETLNEDKLAALLRRSDTPEQRHRLMSVARHHVLRLAREAQFPDDSNAALGISHDAVQRTDEHGNRIGAVYVVMTLPGFPGHAALRPGDIITALDGEPLPAGAAPDRFAAIIKSFDAGTQVTLTVHRDNQTFDAQVTLASAPALHAMYDDAPFQPTFQYASLWRDARARLETEIPPVTTLAPPDEQ